MMSNPSMKRLIIIEIPAWFENASFKKNQTQTNRTSVLGPRLRAAWRNSSSSFLASVLEVLDINQLNLLSCTPVPVHYMVTRML